VESKVHLKRLKIFQVVFLELQTLPVAASADM